MNASEGDMLEKSVMIAKLTLFFSFYLYPDLRWFSTWMG